MTVTTVIIIIVAAFFVIKLFTANPLEGKWKHEAGGLFLTIKGKDTAQVTLSDGTGGKKASATMTYSLDKETKTVTLQADEQAASKSSKDKEQTDKSKKLQLAVSSLEGTYNYSIDKNKLTLTDSEYGAQMIFDKK